MKQRDWIGIITILLVKALLGAITVYQVPLWSAYHHEIDSYNIARIILEERRLPTPADFPPGEFEVRQGSQPPLYGLLSTPIVAAFGAPGRATLSQNPYPFCINGQELIIGYETDTTYNLPPDGHARGGYALRLLNVVFGMTAVALLYAAVRVAIPNSPLTALVSAGLLAFEPYTVLLNSTIVNDNLMLVWGAAHLLVIAHLLRARRLTRWGSGLLLLTAALAINTKINGWVLLAGAILFLTAHFAYQNRGIRLSRRTWLAVAGFIALLSVAVGGLLIFNQLQYGTPFGRYAGITRSLYAIWLNTDRVFGSFPATLRFTLNDYSNALRDVPFTFAFGRLYQLATLGLLLLALMGALRSAFERRWQVANILGYALLIFVGATVLVLLRSGQSQIGARADSLIFAPLRYYAVGLPALMLLIGVGLSNLIPRLRWNLIGAGFMGGWLILSLINSAYNIPGKLLREARLGTNTTLASTSTDSPILIQADSTLTLDNDTLNAVLNFYTPNPLAENYMGEIVVTGANGADVRCQFVPLRGIYPTTRWQPMEHIQENLTISNCVEPLQSPLSIAFNWIDEAGDIIPAYNTELNSGFPISAGCPPNLGRIGDELQLTQLRTPSETPAGRGYEPAIDWLVLKQPLLAQRRIFKITHTDTNQSYTCQGFADVHAGTTSTQQFGDLRRAIPPGLTIYSDACVIVIPDDAPKGVYNIAVRLLDAENAPLRVIMPDGTSSADNWLQLDTVVVR